MTWIVYAIDGPEGASKRYIGVSQNGERQRWKEHVNDARSGRTQSRLHKAMRKHGVEKFRMTILTQCVDRIEALACERGLIAQYGTYAAHDGAKGYNLTVGGMGAEGVKLSPEAREKVAAAKRGKPRPPEVVAKMRESMIACGHRPPLWAMEISWSQRRGRPLPPEHAARIVTSIRARMAKVTHCRNGHEFDGRTSTQRICSVCRRAARARHSSKMAALPEAQKSAMRAIKAAQARSRRAAARNTEAAIG